MGYWTTLILSDVGFRKADRKVVLADIRSWKKRRNFEMRLFLSNVGLGPGGGLEFHAGEDPEDASLYPFDVDDIGYTPAMVGRWSGDDAIARWCASHRGQGRIVYQSLEVDGDAWAYELDGCGRYRRHDLLPAGAWLLAPRR